MAMVKDEAAVTDHATVAVAFCVTVQPPDALLKAADANGELPGATVRPVDVATNATAPLFASKRPAFASEPPTDSVPDGNTTMPLSIVRFPFTVLFVSVKTRVTSTSGVAVA